MPFEEEKKVNQNEWVRWLLSEDHKAELWKILAFWEKYKEEWERLEKDFWHEWNHQKFENLVWDYTKNKRKNRKKFEESLSGEERKIMGNLDEISRDKFYEKYLYEKIVYSWEVGEKNLRENIEYKWNNEDIEWFKRWVVDMKYNLQPWISIDLMGKEIWDEWVKILAREWKHELKSW